MAPPAPVDPRVEQHPNGLSADLPGGAKSPGRFLRTYGFQVFVVLLGIALAFM